MVKQLRFLTALVAGAALTCSTIIAEAQPVFGWGKTTGGTGVTMYPKDVAADAASNSYAIGHFTGTISSNGTSVSSNGGYDIFVQKFSASGQLQWMKSFGSASTEYGQSIAADGQGNVYIAGFYEGTVNFGNGIILNTVDGGRSTYIVKFNPSGTAVWAKGIGADSGLEIELDNVGNVYVAGEFKNTVDFDPSTGVSELFSNYGLPSGYILKLKDDGEFVWVKGILNLKSNIPENKASVNSLVIDGSQNIYAMGLFNGEVDVDPSASQVVYTDKEPSGANSDLFVLKLNSSGDYQWSNALQGVGTTVVGGIGIDDSNNVYIDLAYRGTLDVDPGAGVNNITSPNSNNNKKDIVIQKYNSSGALVWSKTISGGDDENVGGMKVKPSGDVYLSGYFQGSVDFDPGAGIKNFSVKGSLVEADAFMLKLNSAGEYDNFYQFASDDAVDTGIGVALNGSDFFVIGTFAGTPIQMDPLTEGAFGYRVGNVDCFSLKISECVTTSITAGTVSTYTSQCAVAKSDLTAPVGQTNCGESVTASTNATFPITSNQIITWVYQVGGVTEEQTQSIVVNDTQKPVPAESELTEVTDDCLVESIIAPTATDNCAGEITGTTTTTFPITASTTITWSYDDGNGNVETQTQSVVIEDTESPVPQVSDLPGVSAKCVVSSIDAPMAEDNCAGLIEGTTNTSFPINESTTVTWTYDDGNGNVVTQDQVVNIDVETGPTPDVANLPDLTGNCSVAQPEIPTAVDECDDSSVNGVADVTFPVVKNGTTIVTWTFTGQNGKITTQEQKVTVNSISNEVVQDAKTLTAVADAAGLSYQWVDCNKGSAYVVGATSRSFTPSEAGSYAVVITGECTVTSNCYTVAITGIEDDLKSLGVELFPNPVKDVLTISNEGHKALVISLVNNNGKVLREIDTNKEEVKIDLSNYADGIYFIKLNANGQNSVQKIFKN